MTAADPLDAVAAVADAVLFEGYLLYPYRASAQKNALRWQFGVLVPPAVSAALAEPSASRTECVIDARPGATLRLRLRFLGLQRRSVVDLDGTEHDRLEVDGVPHTAWEEGVPRQVDAAVALDVPGRGAGDRRRHVPGHHDVGGDPRRDGRAARAPRPARRGRHRAGGARDRAAPRALRRAAAAPRRGQRRRRRPVHAARGGPAHGPDLGAHRAGPRPRRVPLQRRPAAVGRARRGGLRQRAQLAGAGRAHRATVPCCSRRRSSSRITRSSPRRARRTCSTAPRTTRSSRCAPSPSPTTRSARPGPPTRAPPTSSTRSTPWGRRCSSVCTARSAPTAARRTTSRRSPPPARRGGTRAPTPRWTPTPTRPSSTGARSRAAAP